MPYSSSTRARRIAAGFCSNCCARKPERPIQMCNKCAAYMVTARRNLHRKRLAEGLCQECGRQKPEVSGTRCPACVTKRKADYRRRATEGQCLKCSQRATAGRFCDDHWFCSVGVNHGINERSGGVQMLRELWAAQGGCCALTGQRLRKGEKHASLDHIVPTTRGGTNDRGNLQWVRLDANKANSDMTHDEFVAMCRAVVRHHDASLRKSKSAPEPTLFDQPS